MNKNCHFLLAMKKGGNVHCKIENRWSLVTSLDFTLSRSGVIFCFSRFFLFLSILTINDNIRRTSGLFGNIFDLTSAEVNRKMIRPE